MTSDFSTASISGYTDPAGRDVAASDGLNWPPILLADSSSTIVLVFEAVDPGGRLVLGAVAGDGRRPDRRRHRRAGPAHRGRARRPDRRGDHDHRSGHDGCTPATAAGVASDLIESLGPTLDVSGVPFIDPDESCLLAAIEGLPSALRQAVDALVREPSLFHSLDEEAAAAIALAYVGCVAADELPAFIAVATTRAVDQLPCLAEG